MVYLSRSFHSFDGGFDDNNEQNPENADAAFLGRRKRRYGGFHSENDDLDDAHNVRRILVYLFGGFFNLYGNELSFIYGVDDSYHIIVEKSFKKKIEAAEKEKIENHKYGKMR